MTERERFVDALLGRPVDRLPFIESPLWPQTVERWVAEGAPADLDGDLTVGSGYFGLEGTASVFIDAVYPRPRFEERTLAEDERTITFVDRMGRTRVALKDGTVRGGRMCMDTYLQFPVRDRATFQSMRARYEGTLDDRYPPDYGAQVRRLRSGDLPASLDLQFGYYSMLRNWIGTEPLSYLFYDDPVLVHDCLEVLSEFIVKLLPRALNDFRYDYYVIHEDLAGKGGPLLGPALFREFLLPRYRRFIEFMKSSGVRLILVDTDGDFEALIPVFLEAGVDGFVPMEVAAGMHPLRIRRKYGASFGMFGGVDKRALIRGPAAIDEVLDELRPLLERGGYIPLVDHAVPPDVSLGNFRYYLERKRRLVFG